MDFVATIKEVQARLGHTDIQTMMNIYAHVIKEEKKTQLINLRSLWKINFNTNERKRLIVWDVLWICIFG